MLPAVTAYCLKVAVLVEIDLPGFRPTVFEALLGLFAVFAMACLGGLAVSRLCRRWLGSTAPKEAAFSIAALRRMRDRGEVTCAEYDALVRKLYLTGSQMDQTQMPSVSDKLGRGAGALDRGASAD